MNINPEKKVVTVVSIPRNSMFYVGEHQYTFRYGQRAEVIGIVLIESNIEVAKRPCFHLLWPDGVEDYVPISDAKSYYKVWCD